MQFEVLAKKGLRMIEKTRQESDEEKGGSRSIYSNVSSHVLMPQAKGQSPPWEQPLQRVHSRASSCNVIYLLVLLEGLVQCPVRLIGLLSYSKTPLTLAFMWKFFIFN